MHDYVIIEAFCSLFGVSVVALVNREKHDVKKSKKDTDASYIFWRMVL